jgi:hypothetical protein
MTLSPFGMQNLATDIRGFIVCQEHVASDDRFTPNSGHEMAIPDLPSLSVALEPKMSALPPKAGIPAARINVRFVRIADIPNDRVAEGPAAKFVSVWIKLALVRGH